MSEITEQEASEAATKLAQEYRDLQRAEAEKYREEPRGETEEEFYERVRIVGETSVSGFSALYNPQPIALGMEVPETPVAESDGEIDESESLVPDSNPETTLDAPSHDATEIESNDQTTIIDTGATSPQEIENLQSIATAIEDAKTEESGERDPLATVVDPTVEVEVETEEATETKELGYAEKGKAIKEAQTAEEVDAALGDDSRKPLVAAAKKRKEELAK